MSIAFAALALIVANAATLPAQLANVKPGDTIALYGQFPRITLPKRNFSPSITIDARNARVAGVTMIDVGGVNWLGGTVTARFGPDAVAMASYGFGLTRAQRIRIEGTRITDANRGVVVSASNDVVMSKLAIVDVSVDGVNVASSHKVTLEYSQIGPLKPPFEAPNGSGPIHQDGFQTWNGCTWLRIIGNVVEGNMHGITDFGNSTTAWNIGTVIEGNHVKVYNTHGITVSMTSGAIVRNNIIDSGLRPGRTQRTVLRILPDTLACGNTVADFPTGTGTMAC